jgi:hypothetical protein
MVKPFCGNFEVDAIRPLNLSPAHHGVKKFTVGNAVPEVVGKIISQAMRPQKVFNRVVQILVEMAFDSRLTARRGKSFCILHHAGAGRRNFPASKLPRGARIRNSPALPPLS